GDRKLLAVTLAEVAGLGVGRAPAAAVAASCRVHRARPRPAGAPPRARHADPPHVGYRTARAPPGQWAQRRDAVLLAPHHARDARPRRAPVSAVATTLRAAVDRPVTAWRRCWF